jgi:hypothetical protein
VEAATGLDICSPGYPDQAYPLLPVSLLQKQKSTKALESIFLRLILSVYC